MTHYPSMSALEAMDQSERQNEIVHIMGSDLVHEDLFLDCDDSTEAGEDSEGRKITEYWGETWRVHVHG